MAVYDLGKWNLGETIKIKVDIKLTTTSVYTDPASTLISIRQPDGTMAVSSSPASKTSTGKYEYNYLVPGETGGQLGTYIGKIQATGYGGLFTIQTFEFEGVKSI